MTDETEKSNWVEPEENPSSFEKIKAFLDEQKI
jgi:hypothetical protein